MLVVMTGTRVHITALQPVLHAGPLTLPYPCLQACLLLQDHQAEGQVCERRGGQGHSSAGAYLPQACCC